MKRKSECTHKRGERYLGSYGSFGLTENAIREEKRKLKWPSEEAEGLDELAYEVLQIVITKFLIKRG
jgi:hypothetical protein